MLLFFIMIIVLFIIETGRIKRMQNRQRYWTMCKQIYFASLNLKELSFEQKVQMYEVFNRLGVQGIPYPKGRPSERRKATILRS